MTRNVCICAIVGRRPLSGKSLSILRGGNISRVMTISFKRISRTIPVLFALVLVVLSAVTVLLPAPKASAANAITTPLVWADNDHTNLVDAKNVVFVPLGFFCGTSGGDPVVKGSGTDIEIASKPMSNGKTVEVPADTEAGSSAKKIKVPACLNSHNDEIPANYMWVTQFSSGTNFALVTYGSTPVKIDAQHKPVNKDIGYSTIAQLGEIKNGLIMNTKNINVIKVDTSKAGAVDAGKASNSDNTTPTDTCPIDTWGLRWIACPLFEAANTAINKLEAVVTSWLANDVQGIFGGTNACKDTGDTSCAYYSAWNSFRVLAISLIIIAGIIMVVSEATGMAIFDAYTIRKVLPRLLISVILIAISWWLMKFVVQFFNNISAWIASLISWPFHDVINSAAHHDKPWSIVGQWTIILGAIAVLGPFGILSYAGTIFLALAVGWITLVVRRMLIIFAIMSAPLFIACFIMPNTQKLGKFWRDGFIGLLLMGPVFTLAVTLGQVTAAVSNKGDNSDPFGIITFACLVLPIMSIPVLFSKIGGSVAGLIGFVNDKSKGGFDRLKNYRTNEIQRRGQRAKSGELFGSGLARGKLADFGNKVTSNAALGARGNFGLGAKGKEAYEQRMALLSAQHAKSDAGQAGQFNDDMLKAQTYGSAAEARRNLARDHNMYNPDGTEDTARVDRAMAAAKANGGWGKARQVYAAKQLAVTGTGYDNAQQMLQTIARASGGNESMIAAMVGDARGASKKAGRSDLGGPSFDDLYGTAVNESRAMNGGRDANGNLIHAAPTAEHYRGMGVRAFQNTDGATLSRDKGTSIKNLTNDLYSELSAVHAQARAATNETDRQRFEGQAAALTEQIKNFQQTAGIYAAPAHSRTIHENITAPDRGERRPDGSYSGPNIIQNITNMSSPRQGTQQVVYNRQERANPDGSTTVQYVQNVSTTGAGPAPMPHMQQQAEIYRNSRSAGNNGDLNDPRLPGHDD